ncbi:AAA family ATPase [Jiangella mangrovi]|uniref:DNA-binding CsgD family transcriptional regulator n=1 Tax=Jiangella mangrovi TaxID=1524084 RepID=A0A7W9LM42_9ACTN|nr:DNA-binding CsgD family transcriptional regulator [Jiangella mangrovi]
MQIASAGTAPPIVGRSGEQSRLRRLLADAKEGHGRALVLRGEAGIGKTTLLDHAAAMAGGFRVLRAAGVESEAEIPFAGLQVLLAPVADGIADLPETHARALRAAFGTETAPTDPLLAGAATLLLLSELAERAPLLVLLDDAHWFDRSSAAALLFAVRRLGSDPVAAILTARDGDRPFPADGVESVTLPRLDGDSAAQLLAARWTLPLDVADRVLRESGGNPLAIVELAVGRPADAEAAPLPEPVAPLPATGRLEEHFRGRLHALPEPTRWALLLAAADHRSELAVFTAAAGALGVGVADLEPAEVRELIRVTSGRLEFRHPLVRAAAYQDVPLGRRLAAHRALAEVIDDGDRRAWHLAAAAAGADETAAAALDDAARRALTRGAPAAASQAWERAATLSADRPARARRLVEAARTAYDAGELDRAESLATTAAAAVAGLDGGAPGDPGGDPGGTAADAVAARKKVAVERAGQAAEAGWVRAQVAYERESPTRAAELALEAAAPIVTLDPARATAVLTEASWCARDAADPELLARCAQLLARVPPGPAAEVRDALAAFTTLLGSGPTPSSARTMRALLQASHDGRITGSVERLTGGFVGILIGDDVTALATLAAQTAALRDEGAIGWLPYANEVLALGHLVSGRFRDAEVTVSEALALAAELAQPVQLTVLTSIASWLAAVRGDTVLCELLTARVRDDDHGHRIAAALASWALAVRDLAGAEPAAALERLEESGRGPAGRDVLVRALPDHIDAAVRVGERERARELLAELDTWSRRTESPVASALALRCAAVLDDGPAARDRFEASLRVDGCGPYDRARTRLAYGEWLRRHRSPSAARAQLTEARETFDRIGAHVWTPRAGAELDALGVRAPEQPPQPHGAVRLSPQELQVVRLAAQGQTNREIAAQLFLSPRTVGHHLYKAYPKLGVARRAELGRLDL